jgi:hypothetical protein
MVDEWLIDNDNIRYVEQLLVLISLAKKGVGFLATTDGHRAIFPFSNPINQPACQEHYHCTTLQPWAPARVKNTARSSVSPSMS